MMIVLRMLLCLMFLGLAMPTVMLNSMKHSPEIDEKKCLVCKSQCHHDNEYCPIGFDTACKHGLCTDCFLSTGPAYGQGRMFECDLCGQSFYLILEKTYERSSNQELLDQIYEYLDNHALLLKRIRIIAENNSPQAAVTLLQSAFAHTGKSICEVNHCRQNILHHACKDQSHMSQIDIILQVAQNKAWELICAKDFEGQTPIEYIINAVIYPRAPRLTHALETIKKLLSLALSDEERWHFITRERCKVWDQSVSTLTFAQNLTVLGYGEFEELFELYRPKDNDCDSGF